MSSGFTLLELILSIATIAVIAGFSLPVYQQLQTKNDLDIGINAVAQTLRRSQILSQAVDGDTSWGTKIQSGSITLFQGTSYAGRDTSFDETFDLPGGITPSGVSEIVYAKFTGVPQTTGTITLSTSNNSLNITLNGKGMVSY